MSHKKRIAASLVLSSLAWGGCAEPEEYEAKDAVEIEEQDQSLYADTTRLWPTNGTTASIPVCWETDANGNDIGFAAERSWVRDRVRAEYGGRTPLDFIGWGNCTPQTTSGIRITIADVGPYVSALGRSLSNRQGGMVLNFTFANWGQSCAASEVAKRRCVENIAVHEFGHAAGLAHEQNRPDTNGTNTNNDCRDAPQGSNGDLAFMAWDSESTMSYCNPRWTNEGRLSSMDVEGLNALYNGTRRIADYGYGHLPRYLADVNNDGLNDFCRFVGDEPNIFLSCKLADANGFRTDGEYHFNSVPGLDRGYEHLPRYLADVNADGRADYCRFVGDRFLSCNLATAFGFSSNQYGFNSSAGVDVGYEHLPRALTDVTGDGRADYCRFVGDSPNILGSCMLATTSGFSSAQYSFNTIAGIDLGYSHLPRTFSDANGDGRADFCRYVGDKPNIFLSCAPAWSTGFGPQYQVSFPADTRADYNK